MELDEFEIRIVFQTSMYLVKVGKNMQIFFSRPDSIISQNIYLIANEILLPLKRFLNLPDNLNLNSRLKCLDYIPPLVFDQAVVHTGITCINNNF